MGQPRTTRRDLAALAGALALHALLFTYVRTADERRVFERRAREPVQVELVQVRPPPADTPSVPPADAPAPAPPAALAPEVRPARAPEVSAPPAVDAPEPAHAPDDAPPTAPTTELPPSGESLMRLKKGDGAIGRVLGTGGALGPSAAVLEGALEQRAEGPASDRARAERRLKEMIVADLADDEVTAGLTDDYFRELRNRVETSWRPAMKELNDGGASVTQLGMMRDVFAEREAWNEMWKAYLDLAKQYANGQPPRLEPSRKERLKELMRSRKGMFKFHAISEVVLTQAPDGKVLTIEMPLPSGHPGIDEGVRDALVSAVKAMPEPPSLRVHGGRSFSSTWRMRATWVMVPPTAFLTGAGFDITPKGFQIDVPFDIQLKTNVLLLRTVTHGRESTGATTQDSADP